MGIRDAQAQIVQIIDRMYNLQMQDDWTEWDSKRYSELANQKMILENKLRIEERMGTV